MNISKFKTAKIIRKSSPQWGHIITEYQDMMTTYKGAMYVKDRTNNIMNIYILDIAFNKIIEWYAKNLNMSFKQAEKVMVKGHQDQADETYGFKKANVFVIESGLPTSSTIDAREVA